MSHTVQDKKCNLKNHCCQKTGAKQLQKMAPYKNVCAQKNPETNSVRSKNAAYKNDRGQKIGAKQLKIKNGTL